MTTHVQILLHAYIIGMKLKTIVETVFIGTNGAMVWHETMFLGEETGIKSII